MQPRTQHQIIANAIRVFNRNGDAKRIKSKKCIKAMYKMLYRGMREEGMNVCMVNGKIDMSNLQDKYSHFVDIPLHEKLTNDTLNGYSDRFYNNPYRIYHMYSGVVNNEIFFEND